MSQRYLKNPQTAGRVLGGQAFVITPEDNRLHTLNETATYVWELAEAGGITLGEAAAALTKTFRVTEEQARADIGGCFADLVERQILVIE